MGSVAKFDVGKDGTRRNRRGYYLRHENVGPVNYTLSPIEARHVRQFLELTARRLEALQHNINYLPAFKQAARVIRQMKPD